MGKLVQMKDRHKKVPTYKPPKPKKKKTRLKRLIKHEAKAATQGDYEG